MKKTMSTVGQPQQLQQELQNELITANQLLRLISIELQQIKHFTKPGGEFEQNIKDNASLMKTLASLQHIDFNNLPPLTRNIEKQNCQDQTPHGNQSEMDDSK